MQIYEEEDVHICGLCRAQFSDVDLFIQHKKSKCPVRLARQQESHVEEVRQTSTEAVHVSTVTQFGQQLLPDVDSSQLQAVGSDATVEISQGGSSLGYFPVGDAQVPDTGMGQITQHQYVILPCASEDDSMVTNQVDQSGIQAYSALETVYTLTSQAPLQTTSHVDPSIEEPLNFKTITQPDEPVNYKKSGHMDFATSSAFFEAADQRIIDQSTVVDCVTSDSVQEPMSYEDNLQPVNYSKDNSVQANQSGVLELLQSNNQGQIISELNNFSLQTSGNVTDLSLPSQTDITSSVNFQQTSRYENLEAALQAGGAENHTMQGKLLNRSVKVAGRVVKPKSLVKIFKKEIRKSSEPGFEYTFGDFVSDEVSNIQQAKKKKRPPLEKKFKCSVENCQFKTAYIKDLERHSRTHTGEKPYHCQKCSKMFSRSDKLTLHMRYHSDDRVFKCSYCEYSAVENGSLKKHMKIHLDERPFSCQVCPYKSRSSSQLQIHLRTHTGDTPYSCLMCDAVFKVSSDLQRHIRIHTGEKPYTCKYDGCDYRCAVKSNLKSHYRTHHADPTENKCSFCDFTCSSKRSLFEHKKLHDANPELTCTTCSYQCSNKSALRNHMRIHSDVEKYSCNYCKYKSAQMGNIKAHMKRKHPTKVVPRQTKRRRSGLSNQTEIAMKKQESTSDIETDEKRIMLKGKIQPKCQQNYKCDRCPAAFVREDSLKCHLKHHSDSCLSTAYAVLNLQQPVINPTSTQSNKNQSEADSSTATESDENLSFNESNQNSSLKRDSVADAQNFEIDNSASLLQGQGHILPNQGQTLQGQGQISASQAVTLGINDILLAAGVSGLNSNENLLNSKSSLPADSVAQNLSLNNVSGQNSSLTVTSSVPNPVAGIQNAMIAHSAQDVPSIQVMQNISLPYIRLPNGQVLIITDQRSVNIGQPNGQVQTDGGAGTNSISIQSQLLTQPTSLANQTIQCAADSTVPTPPPPSSSSRPTEAVLTQSNCINSQDGALTQQQAAIPIQIILPRDSQQAVPLVSQLLNSVLNRGNGTGMSQNPGSVVVQGVNNQNARSDNVQSFVLQIPSQSGNAGSIAEGQSFVLQIPAQSSNS